MLAEDLYTQKVAARLKDYFLLPGPWHVKLWGIGTVLAMKEVAEYSQLFQDGAHPKKDGLRYVSESVCKLLTRDDGVGPVELHTAISDCLEKPVESPAGVATLLHLTERVERDYLGRWASKVATRDRPHVEALSRFVGSHLLDSGFSPQFLRYWIRYLEQQEGVVYDVLAILEEAANLCRAPLQEFEVCVPFTSIPEFPGRLPTGWLSATETAAWLVDQDDAVSGDLRQNGSFVIHVHARDQWGAVELADEASSQVVARVSLAPKGHRLQRKGVAWIRGEAHAYRLRRGSSHVRLRSLKTAEDAYRVPGDTRFAALDDTIEILSALEFMSRGSALSGGWAAIEGLLLRNDESPHIIAADRLGDIVACSFPRAALTALSYKHRPPKSDKLAKELAGEQVNWKRALIVEESIRARRLPIVSDPADLAMVDRMVELNANPAETLGRVRRYATETFRRLYTQRNLVMHSGRFQSVTLRATLRTAPSLVGAGIDRLVAASMMRDVEPVSVAARAEAELGLMGTAAQSKLSQLLD